MQIFERSYASDFMILSYSKVMIIYDNKFPVIKCMIFGEHKTKWSSNCTMSKLFLC